MAGRARAVPVRMTVKRDRKLRQVIAAGTSPQRLVLRARIVEISPATIGRILADAHVRPHKVRGWLNRADDPGFWARAGQVCRLYLDPPPGTVLISTFMSFLLMPGQSMAPGLRIHPIMDNGSSHTSKATRAQITAHRRFSVTYTPKHASWLNMTEQWFGVLTRKLLRRGDFTSREHLQAQITEFTIRHNQTAHPYKRSYDADAGHARYPGRHPRQQNLAQAA